MSTPIPNTFYRISIKALIQDENNKFLLALEDNGTWELPGGGLDFGETPQECLPRELKEEMGITTISIAKNPSYFLTWKENDMWRSNVIYETKVANLDFKPSEECVDIRFFSADEALTEKSCFQNVYEFAKILKNQR